MSEIAQGSLAALGVGLTVFSAWIQMLGGRPNGRVYYRLVFPLVFSGSLILVSMLSGHFKLTCFLFFPYYLAVTHMGHTKLHERLLECLMYGLPVLIFRSTFWTVLMLLISTVSTVIGHFGDKKAPVIELLVNFLRVLLVMVVLL